MSVANPWIFTSPYRGWPIGTSHSLGGVPGFEFSHTMGFAGGAHGSGLAETVPDEGSCNGENRTSSIGRRERRGAMRPPVANDRPIRQAYSDACLTSWRWICRGRRTAGSGALGTAVRIHLPADDADFLPWTRPADQRRDRKWNLHG